MPGYNKVQFVAWEVYTGPVRDMNWNPIEYSGIISPNVKRHWDALSQCVDVSARIEFTKKAIELAYTNASSAEDTLKIFMAPEFLYRGAGGAYRGEMLNGWASSPFPNFPQPYCDAWGGLFGGLQDLVCEERFKDWLFVFGTAVGADIQMSQGKIVEPLPNGPPVSCVNAALIQCGGFAHRGDFLVSMKTLKSTIDFITLNLNTIPSVFPTPVVNPGPNNGFYSNNFLNLLENMTVRDSGAVFTFNHIQRMDGSRIKFGIEVCLDHIGYSRNPIFGKLRRKGERVDIQLVPSGGMKLNEESIWLLPEKGDRQYSYAFNCDGLININSKNDPKNIKFGAHVELWSQAADGTCTHLVDIDNSYDPADTVHVPIAGTVEVLTEPPLPPYYVQNAIPGNLLWASTELKLDHSDPAYGQFISCQRPFGPGFIRVLDARPLGPD